MGCGQPTAEEVEWKVLAHRVVERDGDEPTLYWLREDEDGTPTPLRPWLTGFEPQWGVEYRVRVRFTSPSAGPFGDPAGMPSRSLVAVVATTPRPGQAFELADMGADLLGPDRRSLLDATPLRCEPEVCALLEQVSADPEQRFTLALRHGEHPGELWIAGVR